jgi:hypothetical protein
MSMGLDYLKNEIMEGVCLESVASQPIMKRTVQLILINAAVIGGLFDQEVFDDPNYTMGKSIIELETSLNNDANIKLVAYKQFTKDQWLSLFKAAKEKGEIDEKEYQRLVNNHLGDSI